MDGYSKTIARKDRKDQCVVLLLEARTKEFAGVASIMPSESEDPARCQNPRG